MIRRRDIEDYVVLFDNFSGDGALLILNVIFWWAFFNPADAATVTINEFGEKWVEVVLLPLWTLLVVWGSAIRLRRWTDR